MNLFKSVVVCLAAISICGCDQGQPTSTSNADAVREETTALTFAANLYTTEIESLANETSAEGQFYKGMGYVLKNQDFKQAKKWYRKSAEQGYLESQIRMASYYSDHTHAGKECGPDPIEEYAWRGVLIHRCSNLPDMADTLPHILFLKQSINLTSDELAKAKALEAEYIENYSVDP